MARTTRSSRRPIPAGVSDEDAGVSEALYDIDRQHWEEQETLEEQALLDAMESPQISTLPPSPRRSRRFSLRPPAYDPENPVSFESPALYDPSNWGTTPPRNNSLSSNGSVHRTWTPTNRRASAQPSPRRQSNSPGARPQQQPSQSPQYNPYSPLYPIPNLRFPSSPVYPALSPSYAVPSAPYIPLHDPSRRHHSSSSVAPGGERSPGYSYYGDVEDGDDDDDDDDESAQDNTVTHQIENAVQRALNAAIPGLQSSLEAWMAERLHTMMHEALKVKADRESSLGHVKPASRRASQVSIPSGKRSASKRVTFEEADDEAENPSTPPPPPRKRARKASPNKGLSVSPKLVDPQTPSRRIRSGTPPTPAAQRKRNALRPAVED